MKTRKEVLDEWNKIKVKADLLGKNDPVNLIDLWDNLLKSMDIIDPFDYEYVDGVVSLQVNNKAPVTINSIIPPFVGEMTGLFVDYQYSTATLVFDAENSEVPRVDPRLNDLLAWSGELEELELYIKLCIVPADTLSDRQTWSLASAFSNDTKVKSIKLQQLIGDELVTSANYMFRNDKLANLYINPDIHFKNVRDSYNMFEGYCSPVLDVHNLLLRDEFSFNGCQAKKIIMSDFTKKEIDRISNLRRISSDEQHS